MSKLPGSEQLLADLRVERRMAEHKLKIVRREIRDKLAEAEKLEERLRDIDHAEGYLS